MRSLSEAVEDGSWLCRLIPAALQKQQAGLWHRPAEPSLVSGRDLHLTWGECVSRARGPLMGAGEAKSLSSLGSNNSCLPSPPASKASRELTKPRTPSTKAAGAWACAEDFRIWALLMSPALGCGADLSACSRDGGSGSTAVLCAGSHRTASKLFHAE